MGQATKPEDKLSFAWARLLHQRPAPVETPKALTIPAAARYLSCSTKFIRRLIAMRELRYVRVGKRFVVATVELDRWLDENQRHA